jgi:hypothetical protein
VNPAALLLTARPKSSVPTGLRLGRVMGSLGTYPAVMLDGDSVQVPAHYTKGLDVQVGERVLCAAIGSRIYLVAVLV